MTDEATPAPAPDATDEAPEGVVFCTFDDFCKITLTVAEIVEAEDHPNADKLLRLQLKLGERRKQICAGIKAWYAPETLVGKRIVVVDNLEPRKLRGEVSEGMLLAARAPEGDGLTLITTDQADFPSGASVG